MSLGVMYGVSFLFVIILVICVILKANIQEKQDSTENTSKSNEYIYKRDESPYRLGGTNLDRFFVECVLSGITGFSKKANVEKAKLIANKYNLAFYSVEKLYEEAYKAHQPLSTEYRLAQENEIRSREKREYDTLNMYSDLYGRDKKIAMLTEQKLAMLRQANASDNYAKLMMSSTQKAESDWAIFGGIANGLGGIGAGISTAIDIQARNAEIRAQNEANMKAAMPAYMHITGNAAQNRANAETIEEEIQKTKMKLEKSIPPETVMKLLDITNMTLSISQTGAFKITASVAVKKSLTIYDDVPAYIDGTLCASLYDGDTKVASALMVLPLNGVSSRNIGIVGMGLSGAEEGKTYTIKFSPHKMWLMEV